LLLGRKHDPKSRVADCRIYGIENTRRNPVSDANGFVEVMGNKNGSFINR
jgi:hypothetical protein